MGLNDVMNAARDALAAQTFGLTVTGQNVSNANTPGYVRRQAVLETREVGSRNFGTVGVAGLRRVADEFVNQRHLSLTGLSSEASERDQQLGSVEALFNDFEGTGLGSAVNELFSSFSALAVSPTDATTRVSVLDKASRFSERVRATSTELQGLRTQLFTRAQGLTQEINLKADAIADLSGKINQAQAAGDEPADLKDRRDALLLDLSEMVDVRTFYDGHNQLVVQSAGTTLVEADRARHLVIDLAPGGNIRVLAQSASGATSEVTPFLSGGKLGGVVEVRDRDVVQQLADLDTFSFDIASAINAQHAAGFGLDGSTGQNVFTLPVTAAGAAGTIAVDAALQADPNRLAAAASLATLPGDAGNAVGLAGLAERAVSGTLTPGQAYAKLVGKVGSLKAEAASNASTREAMTSQIQNVRDSVSGVSLDEEMVSLTKFQRAFEAASLVLTTVDQLLEELIQRLGR